MGNYAVIREKAKAWDAIQDVANKTQDDKVFEADCEWELKMNYIYGALRGLQSGIDAVETFEARKAMEEKGSE